MAIKSASAAGRAAPGLAFEPGSAGALSRPVSPDPAAATAPPARYKNKIRGFKKKKERKIIFGFFFFYVLTFFLVFF